jgi:hypothetical protein
MPTFLCGSENWTLTALQRRRIEAAEMKLLRPLSGYTLYDHKTNDSIRRELQTECILDKIDEYRRNWLLHLQRMPQNRNPLKSYHYTPKGRTIVYNVHFTIFFRNKILQTYLNPIFQFLYLLRCHINTDFALLASCCFTMYETDLHIIEYTKCGKTYLTLNLLHTAPIFNWILHNSTHYHTILKKTTPSWH